MVHKNKASVKCEGRFHGLREYLYNDAFPLVLEGRSLIKEADLVQVWDLIKDDVFAYDQKDPYYENRIDTLRRRPNLDYLSLVPLIEAPYYGLEAGMVEKYALSMGNSQRVSQMLEEMNNSSLKFFRETLQRESKTVVFPRTSKNLSGYLISANTGIGTILEGGFSGGGVRSDSPFTFGINSIKDRESRDLAVVIGFWANNNEMVVSQMQSCRNAHLPHGVSFGVGCLYLAEVAAREMGFDSISTYSAKHHPIFHEHPKNWPQMGGDFTCIFDGSAKKLGYNGSRTQFYSKQLNG